MNIKDLAMVFYDRMVDNNEDYLEPDSESSVLMNEIDETLFNLLGFKEANKLEEKMLRMCCIDAELYYTWGFEKAMEVARVIYGSENALDQLEKLKYKL